MKHKHQHRYGDTLLPSLSGMDWPLSSVIPLCDRKTATDTICRNLLHPPIPLIATLLQLWSALHSSSVL